MNQGTPDQEMMMGTSMEDLNITNLITGKQNNSEDIDLKEVDSYMDMFLMESTEAKIEEVLSAESIEEMMYEEDRFWNMEEITDWNDNFKIEIKKQGIQGPQRTRR